MTGAESEQLHTENERGQHSLWPQLVTRRVDELRRHPSYLRHQISVPAFKLSAIAELGDLAFRDPLVVTQSGLIIDGYARWERARSQGKVTLLCLEYHLTNDQALHLLLQKNRRAQGLSDFSRIELALDLEPSLQEKGRLNQQAGGRGKGSSKLSEASRVDVRKQIAELAGVSPGNVTKVKRILANGCSELRQASRSRELSIHRTALWSRESPERQLENLRLRRIERGIKKKARELVAKERARITQSTPDPPSLQVSDLISLLAQLSMWTDKSTAFRDVAMAVIDFPGKGLYLTRELLQALTPQQEIFVK